MIIDGLNFIAIDFETATGKRASICEVGICAVRNGEIAETRSWLIQPENNLYSYWNMQWQCTLKTARQVYDFGCNTLGYLCGQLGIPEGTHHRTGDDSEMCARLYLREMEDIHYRL